MAYNAERKFTPLYAGEKISNSRGLGKTYSPIPRRKSQMANPLRSGWRNGFDTSLNGMHQQNGWRAVIMWWFSRPKFCISSVDKRHSWKEKVQKNAQFLFCGQTKAFCYEIVFQGIQPCFLHDGAIGLFSTNQGSKVSSVKKLQVHSVLYGQEKF